MKLAACIHHVNEHRRKGFQGQRLNVNNQTERWNDGGMHFDAMMSNHNNSPVSFPVLRRITNSVSVKQQSTERWCTVLSPDLEQTVQNETN